jgi:hypothetical protein
MRFFWRSAGDGLSGYSGWLSRLDGKNCKPGTSAPTLALAWSGPLDIIGALATHPQLTDVAIHSVTVEAKSSFDIYGGNVRNHDLVLRGTSSGAHSSCAWKPKPASRSERASSSNQRQP